MRTVDRSTALLSDAPAPRASCRIVLQPDPLPSLAQLADSAALVQAVEEFARRHPLRDGMHRALYTLSIDETGRLERFSPIDYWLPRGREQEFTSLVRRHLRPRLSGAATLRLLLQPGSDPVAVVGRSERCPPESRTTFRLTAPAIVQLQRPLPIRVRMHVSEKGRVIGTQVVSSTGNAELERWVTATLERYAFSPGLIDGVAVAMDHEETVQIQARR